MLDEISKGFEETSRFIERNICTANNKSLECVDGRYSKEQSRGAIRIPGGGLGVPLAILEVAMQKGLGIEQGEILDKYMVGLRKLWGEDAKLQIHTDTHNTQNGGIGCGHFAKASLPRYQKLYSPLTPEAVQNLYQAALKRQDVKTTVLEGEHEEENVFLVYSDKWSVNSSDQGEMNFVADARRMSKFIGEIMPLIDIPGIETEDVKKACFREMNVTVGILAGNKEQFKIKIGEEPDDIEITPIGKVSPLS